MKEEERESKPLANLEKERLTNVLIDESNELIETKEKKTKKCCKCKCTFPSAYSVLLIIEILIFILTYIIPKGLFDTIEYSSEEKNL